MREGTRDLLDSTWRRITETGEGEGAKGEGHAGIPLGLRLHGSEGKFVRPELGPMWFCGPSIYNGDSTLLVTWRGESTNREAECLSSLSVSQAVMAILPLSLSIFLSLSLLVKGFSPRGNVRSCPFSCSSSILNNLLEGDYQTHISSVYVPRMEGKVSRVRTNLILRSRVNYLKKTCEGWEKCSIVKVMQ